MTSSGPRRRLLTRRRLLGGAAVLTGGAALLAAGSVTAYLATRYPGSAAHAGRTALRGARVLSGAALDPVEDAVVLIEDGRILAVGPRVGIPEDAEVIETSGATILPGLIDMHTHLAFPDIEPGEEFGGSDIPGYLWDHVRSMPGMRRELLAHGVTAVRSLGDELEWVLDLRDDVADGTLEGPRIFCAGPVLTTPGGHPVSTLGTGEDSDAVRLPGSPQQAETIVAELLDGERPVDLIKVIHESGTADQPLGPHDPEVLAAIAASAHDRGVSVTAHCGTGTDLRQVVEAGFDGVEHLTLRDPAATVEETASTMAADWPEGALEQMAAHGVSLDPTLLVEQGGARSDAPEGQQMRERIHDRLREAVDAGVRIVAGSDAAMPGVPFGLGLVREIEELGAAGLSARRALQAATSQAAAALGSSDIGVIEAGRAADLLVVDGDPLTDLSALHEVVAVLREGRTVVGEPFGASG